MTLPAINQTFNMVIRGRDYVVQCMDVFDAGYGHYFDALFPNALRLRFSEGEECGIPGMGAKGVADYSSYPKRDARTVRFLISKWD
jgi:hypothetical protein